MTSRTDAPAEARAPRSRQRPRTLPWRTVLGLMAASLAIWLLLDAVTLEHNAEVSPLGTRRTVALTILRPLAAISRFTQVSRIESAANGALGRTTTGSGGHTFVVFGPTVKPTKSTKHPPIHPSVTTLPPDPLEHPTASDPLRALLIGDSLGLDLGGPLQNRLASTGVVAATLDGKESTGLTRPDYFDWPAELNRALTQVNPQVVVIMMGANDPQSFLGPPAIGYGTAQWDTEYRHRAVKFMKEATSQGAKLIWVSLPPMRDPALDAKVAKVNALQKEAAAKVPGVIYVSSTPSLSPGGGYTAFITRNGQNISVREPDGIHVSAQGGAVLSDEVVHAMRHDLGIPIH